MKRVIAVVDKIDFSTYANAPWLEYANTYDAVLAKLSFIPEIVTIAPDGDLKLDKQASTADIIQALINITTEPSLIIYLHAQMPFLDVPLLQSMIHSITSYHMEYHFAEGYPIGFAGQIVDSSILPQLYQLAQENPNPYLHQEPNFFFTLMRSKINDFDIETALAPVDLREYRLILSYNNKNNATIANRFVDAGITTLQALLNNLDAISLFNMGLPVYYNFQISSNCPQKCEYCPAPKLESFNKNHHLDLDDFKSTLPHIIAYSGEATIGFNLLGEASLHPNLKEMMQAVLDHPSLHLHIETSGIGWQEEAISLLEVEKSGRITIILSLDSLDAVEYKKMRGEGYPEVMHFMQRLLAKETTKKALWLQRMRLAETEEKLQHFYQQAKELTSQIIIQKYQNYAQFLPTQSEIDLAPLVRRGCWALQREMSIYLNGDVHLCRVDIQGKEHLGNIYRDSLEVIWKKSQYYYHQHINQNYPSLCNHCEEYYIYTF